MDTTSICENNKGKKERLKNQQLEDTAVNDNNTKEDFPWLPKFSEFIRSSIGSRNYQHLEGLLLLYTQNITSSIAASNVKSIDIINIKNHINNMLIFFHLYWLDIKQNIADHNSYLNRMSALLNVYIDIELKTSTDKRCSSYIKDSSKIAAKILAALYIYLNNSEEHIFRVLLRIKSSMEKYAKIYDHLFMKSFTNLTTKTTFMTDVAYVRYLLAFKMWKKMAEDYDRKGRINKLALMLLGLRTPKMRDELLEFVPRPPVDQENETLWLLQSNLFDLKQSHKHFLLFEDNMNKSTDSQSIETIHADQSCSIPQKNQVNLLSRQCNSTRYAPNQQVNKNHSDVLQNLNVTPGIDGNKSMDRTYLQKKGSKSLKPLKKMRKKPKKTIIIDLTGDDEISVPYKVKQKKTKKLDHLKIMKKKHKLEKHINKNTSRLMDADTQACSNNINKNFDNRGRLECKPISDYKVNDNTQSCTLNNSKYSLIANCVNPQKNEHASVTKSPMNNVCPEFAKEDEMQHDYNSYQSKMPKLVDQSIKEFKVMANLSRENKMENHLLSQVTYAIGNAIDSYNNSIMQGKEVLTSQEDSAMETMPLFKTCQSNIANQHSFKQELPTSTSCGAMQKLHKCCNSVPVDMNDIKHLMKKLKSINDHSSQITEIIKQKVCHQVNECPNCCTKIDCKPFVFTSNDVIAAKAQNALHDTLSQDENDVKSPCDTNIIYFSNNIQSKTLEGIFRQSSAMSLVNYNNTIGVPTKKSFTCADNDVIAMKMTHDALHDIFNDNENDVKSTCDVNTIYMVNDHDKCVYAANQLQQTGESAATMDSEKRVQCLDNPNDMCVVSTTFIEDQIAGSLLDNQHVNFETMKLNDYRSNPKYSEATMKEEQEGTSNCDISMLNNRLHSSESCAFDVNSLDIDSKEANEIMKTDCIDELENISFLHNIESLEETLDDVLRQPSLISQMNCDSLGGESKDLKESVFPDDVTDFLSSKRPFELDNVYCNVLSDVPGFKDDQEIQPPGQHEFFFADGDRKATSPKQFEKVSWSPDTCWHQSSCSWCLV